jgi:hypothetical protein
LRRYESSEGVAILCVSLIAKRASKCSSAQISNKECDSI